MPLLVLLEAGLPLVVLNALPLADLLEHILDARHHALQTAEVDVGAVVELGEDLVGVLRKSGGNRGTEGGREGR